ncbi:MAG: alpha/beta hydrolase [Halioglobus sp.]
MELIQAQIDALREQLQPLNDATELPPESAPLLAYYGLDFGLTFPHASLSMGWVSSGEFDLATYRWLQPGATDTLLLVHGYLDHVGLFAHLIHFGLERGYNVLAFDLPGHGLSSGQRAGIDDFSSYSAAIADVLTASSLDQQPLRVIAQSTGGAALVDLASRGPWPFEQTVLLAPLVRPADWWKVRLMHTLAHRFIDDVPRQFAKNSTDLNFLEFIQRDPMQSTRIQVSWVGALKRWLSGLQFRDLGVGPALVIQGQEDTTVDWRYNMRRIEELFPGSAIEYIPDAGHHLANESERWRNLYLARIAAHFDQGSRAAPGAQP